MSKLQRLQGTAAVNVPDSLRNWDLNSSAIRNPKLPPVLACCFSMIFVPSKKANKVSHEWH
jgi:hypothetical protein